ncbi:MAG: PD-(D/E)XK nuclease family protein, partial [Bacteroidota bacterium]
MTPAEEKVISYFIEEFDAQIFWDFDAYYVEDVKQEAGRFLREHMKKRSFEDSLKKPWPDNFSKIDHLEVIATPFQIGQTKRAGELLKGMTTEELEKTVIVIPDDQMLFPALYALPKQVDKINITMGYPLRSSPLYNLIDLLLQLQLNIRTFESNDFRFYHKQVIAVLRHPYLRDKFGETGLKLSSEIERYNQIFIKSDRLITDEFSSKVFKILKNRSDYFDYLRIILPEVVMDEKDVSKQDVTLNEFIYQSIRELNKLETIVVSNKLELSIKEFYKITRQVMRSVRVPFDGEPLQGLQIMGVLETRNLDFDTVIFLGLNEGLMPATGGLHSYIPYNLRKAFSLPTFDQQDAIYAYLFYRLIQRSKKAFLFYNSEVTQRISGEPSRYIQQLRLESGLDVKESVLVNPVNVEGNRPIVVEKRGHVLSILRDYTKSDQPLAFTPTALSTYLDCRLRFYFKYIQKIKEPEVLEEEIDNRIFGNILHKALENVYNNYLLNRDNVVIEAQDFTSIRSLVKDAVDEAFRSQFHVEDNEFKYEGRNIIIFEMILKMVDKVLQFDKGYAPFQILGLEQDDYRTSLDISVGVDRFCIQLRGGIDRVDKKENTVRIIDYKTGKDNQKFEDIKSLFDREDKNRNKAAMQTLLYSYLYSKNTKNDDSAIQPGLFNAREMFDQKFDPVLQQSVGDRKFEPVLDATTLFKPFEEELKILLQELFNPTIPFDQTEDLMKCSYCPYKEICDR